MTAAAAGAQSGASAFSRAAGASVRDEPLRSSRLVDRTSSNCVEPARYAGPFAVHA